MAKVDEETAKLVLLELAEAFGIQKAEAGVPDPFFDWATVEGEKMEVKKPLFLGLVAEGRLYVEDGRAVFVLCRPLKLENGQLIERVSLREPSADDYLEYSRGMSLTVKDGATTLDTAMMTRRAIRAVASLGEVRGGEGVVGRFPNRDIRVLGELCDALGFFE